MKKFLTIFAFVAGLLPLAANADYIVRTPSPVYVVPSQPRVIVVPRDPLTGTTRMRVHNQSPYDIVHIDSSNSQYGTTYRWGSILGFRDIPSNSVAVVDFGDHSTACVFYVRVTTADGNTHVFGNINVCATNDIVIPAW